MLHGVGAAVRCESEEMAELKTEAGGSPQEGLPCDDLSCLGIDFHCNVVRADLVGVRSFCGFDRSR